jgi:UPF0755 protein
MSAKKKNTLSKQVLRISLAVFVLMLIAVGVKLYEDVWASNIRIEKGEKAYVYVGTKKTLEENQQVWERSGLFKNVEGLMRIIRYLGFEYKLKPGRYEVDASMNNYKLVKLMVGGKQTPMDITFKYAERKEDLVRFWCTKLEADSFEMAQLMNDSSIFGDLGLDTLNSVSMFIPNTYNFYWNTSAEDLLLRQKKEYETFWNEDRKAKAAVLNLTPKDVSIMASIVQKETYQSKEMPVVAGVYYNRLKRGMPFQADPTILFALNDKSIRRVSGAMLKENSPYNTYLYTGLVPGPICVPSVQAIDAVLNLQNHNYLYFCAKEDFSGFHNFAATFAQHQINARKYQRELNKRGIH